MFPRWRVIPGQGLGTCPGTAAASRRGSPCAGLGRCSAPTSLRLQLPACFLGPWRFDSETCGRGKETKSPAWFSPVPFFWVSCAPLYMSLWISAVFPCCFQPFQQKASKRGPGSPAGSPAGKSHWNQSIHPPTKVTSHLCRRQAAWCLSCSA